MSGTTTLAQARRPSDRLILTLLRSSAVSTRGRRWVVIATLLVTLVIGIADGITGEGFLVGMVYMVPVAIAALVVTTREAYALALIASATRLLSYSVVFGSADLALGVWNFLGRFVSMCVVVHLIGALRESSVRLAAAERTTRDFLATAAHQLRTPMAGLLASAEALSTETDPEVRRRLAANLEEATRRSRRLVNGLLELSRAEQAQVREMERFDVAEEGRRLVGSTAILHPDLNLEWDGPRSLVGTTSRRALDESLTNLLDNASRHAATTVAVVVRTDGDLLHLDVRDDGPGIEPDTADDVFAPFVSLDEHGGSGLGLAIARASVEAAGGALVYADRAFRVTLPLDRDPG